MTTTICIDGHVHIYPFYNMQNAVQTGMRNLQKIAPKVKDSVIVWLLTERFDCEFFNSLPGNSSYKITATAEPESLILHTENDMCLYICAGRQIVTSDNLEICALATTLNIKDRTLNTMDTIHAVNDAGGVAALNWAPGKWFFKRKKIVQHLLTELDPAILLINDTSLRPLGWATPLLMKSASRHGFKVIAGSDPLPFAGEEALIGCYGFTLTGQFDAQTPARSIRSLLTDPAIVVNRSGQRNMPVTFIKRQTKVMMLKKKKQ